MKKYIGTQIDEEEISKIDNIRAELRPITSRSRWITDAITEKIKKETIQPEG